MKVKLKNEFKGTEGASRLSADRDYYVIGIVIGNYRIVNDCHDPVLYPSDMFIITDPQEPQDWINIYDEDGDRLAYPKEMINPGFFEDYHDRIPEAVKVFWDYYHSVYGREK
jgi:hypothetical protein